MTRLTGIVERPILVLRQELDCPVGVPNLDRVDSKHRTAPACDFLIMPDFHYPVCSSSCNLRVDGRGIRQDASKHDDTARVLDQFGIIPPGTVQTLVYGVQAVIRNWWRRHMLRYLYPLPGNGLTETLLPLASDVEPILPVRNLVK